MYFLFCLLLSLGTNISSAWQTNELFPPFNLIVSNITETALHLSWNLPNFFKHKYISGYDVTAAVIRTYAEHTLPPLTWGFSNNTMHTELLNLHPGTTYNISIKLSGDKDSNLSASVITDTVIGEPDPSPSPPIVKERSGTRMVIRLPNIVNNNGPISAYRLVVAADSSLLNFEIELLKSFAEAQRDGLSYYIAAELKPKDITNTFVIGDGRTYGEYFNAPLPEAHLGEIHVISGVVSSKDGLTKMRYGHRSQGVLILDVLEADIFSSSLEAGLTAAIGVFGIILVLSVLMFFILRHRLQGRVRIADQQELALRGPMIELENSGYLAGEDDELVDHYSRLKHQVWNIPRNFLTLDKSKLVGFGDFGDFFKALVNRDTALIECVVVTISDYELDVDSKRKMLRDLDVMIKVGKHSNLQSLIGTCESPNSLFVALEYFPSTLKEVLLQSRQIDSHRQTYSTLLETQVLQYAVQVALAMEYLSKKKIIHKHLCSRNMLMTYDNQIKVSGHGLTHMRTDKHNIPGYVRWSAMELFRAQSPTVKTDVWAFGVVLWECCTLGGTPYVLLTTQEVRCKVIRGLRLPQDSNISDELFQIALNCWQTDSDERPHFTELVDELRSLQNSEPLSFRLKPGFQYVSYVPQLEYE